MRILDSKDIPSGMEIKLQGSLRLFKIAFYYISTVNLPQHSLRHAGDSVENAEDLEALDAEVVVEFGEE